MRKILRIVLLLVVLIAALLLYFDQSRRFYCAGKNRCITVWKRVGGICYIIPGKYYGLIKPSDNYIKTTNVSSRFGNNYFTFFFTDEMPNTIMFNTEGEFEIKNSDKGKIVFLDYHEDVKRLDKILYIQNAKETDDLKENADLILLDTKENYATDKNGKKL